MNRDPNRLHLQSLRQTIKPFRLLYFPRLRSTNDHAATLRKRGELFAPACVVAGKQTSGRGRGSNTWWSKAGCLTITFVVPMESDLVPHQLPLLAGLAVRRASAELAGDDRIGLKWPNDILFNNRKLAGLLCERVHNADLIGIGLNVNILPTDAPRDLRDSLTSLRAIKGEPIEMHRAIATLASHLHALLRHRRGHPFAELLHEYRQHHVMTGRAVRILTHPNEPQITGKCEGIDHLGRLLVKDRKQTHRIISGQVLSR